jgi:hypothetical protein
MGIGNLDSYVSDRNFEAVQIYLALVPMKDREIVNYELPNYNSQDLVR